MNDVSLEVALTGGRLTDDVVRVGGTVRRPRKPSSAFVARLLRYLEEVDFMGAPRYLGVDELGRDVFIARQEQNARWWMDRLDDGILTADRRRYAHEAIEWTLRERAFTATHRDVFSSALPDTSRAASIAGQALAERRFSA